MPETQVEVTRGEFDPREYKSLDKQNWAKKRRADWMATTGKIQFVRERIVPSEEREIPAEHEKVPTPPDHERAPTPPEQELQDFKLSGKN